MNVSPQNSSRDVTLITSNTNSTHNKRSPRYFKTKIVENMKKEDRLKIYRKYDGHCAYCGKSIEYKDMQVDHLVPKNRGCYSRWSDKAGKFVVSHGDDSMENYMPSCRSCNLRKRDMSLEQFRSEITRQAKGLLNGKASFQVKMSLAYGLIEEHFDRQIEFYFEKFK